MMQPIVLKKANENDDLMRETFSSFDIDGDGYITRQELVTFMSRMGETLNDEQVSDLMGKDDIDGDGRISYEGNKLQMSVFLLKYCAE